MKVRVTCPNGHPQDHPVGPNVTGELAESMVEVIRKGVNRDDSPGCQTCGGKPLTVEMVNE